MRRSLLALSLVAALGLGAMTAHAEEATTSHSALQTLEAVVDTRTPARDGYVVLAVTPGGFAERLGLQAEDRLQRVNGVALLGAPNVEATLANALEQGGGRVRLEVVRGGRPLSLSGSLDAMATTPLAQPASDAQGCGYVSATDPTPDVSEGIFDAEITMIDGRSTPLYEVNRQRLGVGSHVLVVSEFIKDHRFSPVQRKHRRLMKRRELARAYKALMVDVQPDTRYSIGARLLTDKLDNESIRNNEYWEPVVWTQRPESCR
ncbi:MAG: PDZ domain-containing protein [Lysobacteraceae bacterium]